MNKQLIMSMTMNRIVCTYVLPTIERGCDIEIKREPIKYNAALDENDYLEYIARKQGTMIHIHNRRENKHEKEKLPRLHDYRR